MSIPVEETQVANKYMKTCLFSAIFREIQYKMINVKYNNIQHVSK